jgi:hypothetical protein
MIPLEASIKINSLPNAPTLRFDKETILPYAKGATVYPIIEAGDLDG